MLGEVELWPHCPWVQPSLFDSDALIAVCGCGWQSEVVDSDVLARLACFAHLDSVRLFVEKQEARMKEARHGQLA